MTLRLALALLVALPLSACGGGSDSFDDDVEETGQPGVLGRIGEMQSAMEQMQEQAEQPTADPVNFRTLRDLLPEEAAGLPQAEVEGSTDAAMGFSISQVEADYQAEAADGGQITIQVMDYGAFPSMTMMGLGWTVADIDRESGSSYERTVTFGGERGYRTYDTERESGEFSLSVADRFVVQVAGRGVSDDELEAALRAVDLAGLSALRDEGRRES